ncbi:MAG: hypothetical protein ACLPTJ_18115 [Solirubrobacteraceae bacterium]
MSKLPIPILAAVLVVAVAPAAALAGTGNHTRAENVATTKTYIQADYLLAHTARINMLSGEAALESLQQTLSAECPMAAAASPENEAAAALSNEVIGAMSVVFIRADIQVVDGFAETVAHLHWSNQKLTHKVKIYAAKFKVLAALEMPDVCGDVRAWAASGYRTLPASTTQFDEHYSANNVGIGEIPTHLLAPYEDSHEREVLTLTRQFESELVDAEARAVAQWSKILNALDLQP